MISIYNFQFNFIFQIGVAILILFLSKINGYKISESYILILTLLGFVALLIDFISSIQIKYKNIANKISYILYTLLIQIIIVYPPIIEQIVNRDKIDIILQYLSILSISLTFIFMGIKLSKERANDTKEELSFLNIMREEINTIKEKLEILKNLK